jgi:tetratricopeptide (TPR) repeat protein
MKILGRSLVDCFCRYVDTMISPDGDYPPPDPAAPAAEAFDFAFSSIQRSRLVEARTFLESVTTAAGPASAASVRLILVAVLADLGHAAPARRALDLLLAERPADGRLFFLAGQLAERTGQVEQAIAHYQVALALGGAVAEDAAERLAAVYLATDDCARARDMLLWLVDARPDDFLIRVELSSVLSRLGENEAAIRAYEDAILMDPDEFEVRQDYAAALESGNRPADALAELARILEAHPEFADVHLRAAKLCGQLHNLPAALAHAEAALHVNPRFLEALILRGLILTELGRTDDAIAAFHRALEVNEQYTVAYAGLALAQDRAGLAKESAETMELARTIAPGAVQIYARLSRLGLLAGVARDQQAGQPRSDSAASQFVVGAKPAPQAGADRVTAATPPPQAHKKNGTNPTPARTPPGATPAPQAGENGGTGAFDSSSQAAVKNAAATIDHDQSLRRQIEAHRQAVARNPRYADVRYYYGLLLSSLGRTEEALEQYRAAVEINPRYVEALVRLALIYWQTNRPDEALQALKQAETITPAELAAHYRFGLLWADRGLWSLTVQTLERRFASAYADSSDPAAQPRSHSGDFASAIGNLGLAAQCPAARSPIPVLAKAEVI